MGEVVGKNLRYPAVDISRLEVVIGKVGIPRLRGRHKKIQKSRYLLIYSVNKH